MNTSVARADIDHGTMAAAYAQAKTKLEGILGKFDAGVANIAVPPGLLSSVETGNPKRADFSPKPILGLEDPVQISDSSVQRIASAFQTASTIFSGSTVAGQGADRLLARLIVQLSALLAKGELDERLNKRHLAKMELLVSAEKTRSSASEERKATLISSIATIAASAIAIGVSSLYAGGSMMSMRSSTKTPAVNSKTLTTGGDTLVQPRSQRISSASAESNDPVGGQTTTTPVNGANQAARRPPSVTAGREPNPGNQTTQTAGTNAENPTPTSLRQNPTNQRALTGADDQTTAQVNQSQTNPAPLNQNQTTAQVGQNPTEQRALTDVDNQQPTQLNQNPPHQPPVRNIAATDTAAAKQAASLSELSMSQQRSTMALMGAQTFSQLGPAVGGVSAMESAEQAKLEEADSKAITAQAEETKSEGDMNAEMRQSLYEMIKALLEFCKEINAAIVAKMMSISKG